MEWSELYPIDNQPSLENISSFANNELFEELTSFLQETYHILPKTDYSKCSAQKGWNIKFQKSGKSLCTIYPMKGFAIVLVVIGEKQMLDTERLLPILSDYTKSLFLNTRSSVGGKWLMIHLTDRQILEDVKNLIKIRVSSK